MPPYEMILFALECQLSSGSLRPWAPSTEPRQALPVEYAVVRTAPPASSHQAKQSLPWLLRNSWLVLRHFLPWVWEL